MHIPQKIFPYAVAYASLIFSPYAYVYHMQAYACDMHMHVIYAYAFDNTVHRCVSIGVVYYEIVFTKCVITKLLRLKIFLRIAFSRPSKIWFRLCLPPFNVFQL